MPALRPSTRGPNHPLTTRILKEPKEMKGNVKPKQARMVSIAPILKRKPMKELYVPKYKLKKREPIHPLYQEYKDCIETSRAAIQAKGNGSLDEAYQQLLDRVKEVKLENDKELNTVQTQISALTAPLGDEEIVVTTVTGKKVQMKLSEHVSAFRSLLNTEEEELKTKWANWEKIQTELATLGAQVLGEKGKLNSVKVDVGKVKGGYREQCEKLQQELEKELVKPMKDVEAAKETALKAFGVMEKECDQKFKLQKAKVIAMITEDD